LREKEERGGQIYVVRAQGNFLGKGGELLMGVRKEHPRGKVGLLMGNRANTLKRFTTKRLWERQRREKRGRHK